MTCLVSPFSHLGFKVNLDKNCLNPSPTIFSIGVALDTTTTMAFLSSHHNDNILYLLQLLQRSRLMPYVAHLCLFDMLASQLVVFIVFIVPPAEVVEQFRLRRQGEQTLEAQGHNSTFLLGPHGGHAYSGPYLSGGIPTGCVPSRREVVTTDACPIEWEACGKTGQLGDGGLCEILHLMLC